MTKRRSSRWRPKAVLQVFPVILMPVRCRCNTIQGRIMSRLNENYRGRLKNENSLAKVNQHFWKDHLCCFFISPSSFSLLLSSCVEKSSFSCNKMFDCIVILDPRPPSFMLGFCVWRRTSILSNFLLTFLSGQKSSFYMLHYNLGNGLSHTFNLQRRFLSLSLSTLPN